jgi:glutamate racemase
MDNRPIGVFDSGLGGITVVKEIHKVLPKEKIIYLGDTARVPYGTRSKDTVVKFSLENTKFLEKFKIKFLLIACNTASALAYEEVKNSVSIPVVDVINPGAEAALRRTLSGRIGVIATKGTILSHAYAKVLRLNGKKVKVYEQSCPLFVPLIEEGEISGRLINLVSEKYLNKFKKNSIDTLILGCTHYPIIKKTIQRKVGKKVSLVNSGAEAARKLGELLKSQNLLAEKRIGEDEYYLTDLTTNFINVAEEYLGIKISSVIQKVYL